MNLINCVKLNVQCVQFLSVMFSFCSYLMSVHCKIGCIRGVLLTFANFVKHFSLCSIMAFNVVIHGAVTLSHL